MTERTPWRNRLFPELQHLDPPEQKKGLRAATRRVWRNWRTWVFFVLFVGAIAAAIMLAYPITRRLPIPPAMFGGIAGGLLGGMLTAAVNLAFRRPIRRFLREDLVARGIPICLKCAYDLRGQTQPRCPECGISFDPKLIRSATDID